MTILGIFDFDDLDGTTIFVFFVLVPILSLVINYFFLKFTFEVKTIVRNQKLQTEFLELIAKKLEVDSNEIEEKKSNIDEPKDDENKFWKV